MGSPADELGAMLIERDRSSDSDQKAELDARVHERFGATRGVMITDMSGFSRITKEHGILHFLAMIERMKRLCLPHIEAHGGTLIKTVGDDLFCGFETAEGAVRAGIAMMAACEADAEGRDENHRIELAVGVGYGFVLDLDGTDLFGDEVNRASKLGEDIAEPGELLLTQAVADHTGDIKGWWFEKRSARISAISFDYYAAARNR